MRKARPEPFRLLVTEPFWLSVIILFFSVFFFFFSFFLGGGGGGRGVPKVKRRQKGFRPCEQSLLVGVNRAVPGKRDRRIQRPLPKPLFNVPSVAD